MNAVPGCIPENQQCEIMWFYGKPPVRCLTLNCFRATDQNHPAHLLLAIADAVENAKRILKKLMSGGRREAPKPVH